MRYVQTAGVRPPKSAVAILYAYEQPGAGGATLAMRLGVSRPATDISSL
jgi:hypothetical protein